jgi:cytosine/adenosine deaminase-related metal-dependent hydrolase
LAQADLVIVDPQKWTMLPLHDPISSIVYCMRTENISSVMCDGQWIMREHKILTVDEVDVIARAKSAAKDLIVRAGIQLPKRPNIIM